MFVETLATLLVVVDYDLMQLEVIEGANRGAS